MSLYPQESARLNHEHHYGAFRASVPSRAGKFPPLPKRQSPKPWDLAAIEAHALELAKRSGMAAVMPRLDKLSRESWGQVLTMMAVGESIVSYARLKSVQAGVRKYTRLMEARFTVEPNVAGKIGWKVTRVG